ncbi:MAG: hypothetical protein JXR84_15825, partial [Anaerolineae bacterium]|nr:hypothetical protein [Anaerolineae bacterium]
FNQPRSLRFPLASLFLKKCRVARTFIIKRMLFEPDYDVYDAVLPALVEKLRAFAAFNGCDNFAVEDVQPEKIKVPLSDALAIV